MSAESHLPETEHGQGYGGKPSGDYYRMNHDFTCEQTEAPVASIHWSGHEGILIENKKMKCNANSLQLTQDSMDISIYQTDVIGYKEGIFEGLAIQPAKIPANLVEVWCRDRADEQGVETITHFNASTQQAVNTVFYSDLQNGSYVPKEIADIPVARIAGANEITVSDSQGFELKVYRDRPAAQLGLFEGHLEAVINNQKVSRETSCRLGGSLDPKLWPSKQIVDFNLRTFLMSPDTAKIAFTSNSENGIFNLYGTNSDGSNSSKISGNKSNTPWGSFTSRYTFSSDSRSLLYADNPRQANVIEFFKIDVSGWPAQGVLLDNSQESISQYLVSKNNLFAVYSGLSGTPGAQIQWIKSVSLITGLTTPISTRPYLAAGSTSYYYNVSAKQNKIVFIDDNAFGLNRLWKINSDGTGKEEIPVPLPSADWNLDPTQNLRVPDQGDYVVLKALNLQSKAVHFYRVAIDGSGSVELPAGLDFYFANSSAAFGIIGPDPTEGNAIGSPLQWMDFQKNKAFPLLNFKSDSLFFSQGSNYLVGSEIQADGRLKAKLISTADGSALDLCPGTTSAYLQVEELEMNSFLIASIDASTQTLKLFIKGTSGNCRLVNSVPGNLQRPFSALQIKVSPDKRKVLALLTSTPPSGDKSKLQQQLVFIPLSGQPPLLITTPTHVNAFISQFFFLSDSRGVVYTGNQLTPEDLTAFKWQAPP
jgi:hypothetical protein